MNFCCRRHRLVVLVALLCCAVVFRVALPCSAQTDTSSPRRLTLAVFAYLGEEQTWQQYQPIVDYLNQELAPLEVVLEVLPQEQIDQRIEDGTLDLVTTNPMHFVRTRAQFPLTGVIATLVAIDQGRPLHHQAGVIIVKAARQDIFTLADVKGRRIGTPSVHHLGGFRAQAFEMFLAQTPLSPEHDPLVQLTTHQQVVRAVLDDTVDVGFIRSGVLETMQELGELDLSLLRVINPMPRDDFSLLASTRLYPEWPVFALPHVDYRVIRRVAAALYALEPDHPAARAARIYGYTIPADYLAVENLSRALRLPPYDAALAFTLGDVLERWKYAILAALIVLLAMAVLLGQLVAALRRERQVREQKRLLDGLGEGVIGLRPDARCSFINAAALEMLHSREEDVLGGNIHELFHHHKADGSLHPLEECRIRLAALNGQKQRFEDWFIRASGEGFPVELVVTPVVEGDPAKGSVIAFRDITKRKRLEREMLELATIDSLTDLPNRRYFLATLGKELARVARSGPPACLLALDLDHFKQVNDSYGHATGDMVLRAFADIMRGTTRHGDVLGRLGGEEFAILLPLTALDSAMVLAERLRSTLAATRLELAGQELSITVSIGCTALRMDDGNVGQALERADRLLYQAKATGRNRVVAE